MPATEHLAERKVGHRDGYLGRQPVPHVHWSEAQKDAYSDGWNEGAAKRAAEPSA